MASCRAWRLANAHIPVWHWHASLLLVLRNNKEEDTVDVKVSGQGLLKSSLLELGMGPSPQLQNIPNVANRLEDFQLTLQLSRARESSSISYVRQSSSAPEHREETMLDIPSSQTASPTISTFCPPASSTQTASTSSEPESSATSPRSSRN